MKRILLFATLLFFSVCGNNAISAQHRPEYVPGEVLIKYKLSVSASSIEGSQSRLGIRAIKEFKYINVRHVKLPADLSVEDALEIYRNDPNVEYAEPNYYRYATSTTPDDTYFENLWGLNNTGQSVNGVTPETAGADIDALEAWDIATGSSDLIIAVIDSGVAYNHEDLIGNIWSNTDETLNGSDDDGNGYVDDVRGWDFVNGDNDPIDSNDHGTHVAGTIAAKGNNATGITGVCWTAKIMPLRFLNAFGIGSVDDAISAIDYAKANGAKIINASYGSTTPSDSEKDAIIVARDAGILFVAAAGNGGNDEIGDDNDTTPYYPASYDLSNIISVAATDQDDALCSFSNYGAVSVDVGAPGKNIYSTRPARQTVWSDNFDDGNIKGWATGGTKDTWGLSSSISSSASYSLTDSPAGDYQNDTNSWARVPVLNLSSHSGTKLGFKLRGISETDYDLLYVETSTDGSIWSRQDILIGSTVYTSISGTTSGDWFSAYVDLGAYDGESTVHIRFRFYSNEDTVYDGWYIDDVTITAASSSYSDTEYQYMYGTSMAAPHVAGLAGLIWGKDSSLTMTEVKDIILNSVDSKDSLTNKTTTGGRINAFNALPPPAPGGLAATAASSSKINLSWADNSANETGFKIERKTGGGTYEEIATVSANVTSYSSTGLTASTTYYYRVRAYNSGGNSSYSSEANATTSAASGGGGGGGGCFITTVLSGD